MRHISAITMGGLKSITDSEVPQGRHMNKLKTIWSNRWSSFWFLPSLIVVVGINLVSRNNHGK